MTISGSADDPMNTSNTGRYDNESDSSRAQTLQAVHESAKDALEAGDKNQCRRICLELERDTALPLPIRCSIYHLLAQCSGPDKVEYYLDFAAGVIDSMGQNDEETKRLREENDALRDAFSGELFGGSDEEEATKRGAEGEEGSVGVDESESGSKRRRGF